MEKQEIQQLPIENFLMRLTAGFPKLESIRIKNKYMSAGTPTEGALEGARASALAVEGTRSNPSFLLPSLSLLLEGLPGFSCYLLLAPPLLPSPFSLLLPRSFSLFLPLEVC